VLGRRASIPSLLTLMRLACACLVVGYCAWRYRFPKDVTIHDRQQATNGQGERPMTSEMAGPEGEQMIRWMEEGPAVLEGIRRMQGEYAQAKEVAKAAQKDRERLQQNCEELREEVRRLQAEAERLRTERAETAQWFAAMIRETAARLRIEPPPA
jgi:hypothetical protein